MSAVMKFNLTALDANGAEANYEVSVTMADLARYDIQRAKLGFPKKEEAEFLFMVLVSYCSLVRSGQIPVTTKPEAFIDTVVNIEPEDAEEEAEADKSE